MFDPASKRPFASPHRTSAGLASAFTESITQLANERHYSVAEVAKLWALSKRTVKRMFEDEPGVLQWGTTETVHKRGYVTLRIPESVLQRVHRKLRKAA